jgi:PhzF family phenazine biosynthesis protein
MHIPIYQVDAFSSHIFAGNPAAICPLSQWLPDQIMQAIALENNLSETAFFVRNGDDYDLRWFTPLVEVDLCGHATLASAWVLFHELHAPGERVTFNTKSGKLTVEKRGELLVLNFPARPPSAVQACAGLVDALGGKPEIVLASSDYLVVYRHASDVKTLQPDMAGLSKIDKFAVIVTAPGDTCDFVSRFFAPAKGVPEDPVTGRAHCTLIPYWAKRLNKDILHARQLSKRGGELYCQMLGDRVEIAGRSVLFLKGEIYLSASPI